jgi:YHS domain-containing protein
VPVDPVCGIELDSELAVTHDYEGKKLYFCCNGCRIFMRKPRKWKKNI